MKRCGRRHADPGGGSDAGASLLCKYVDVVTRSIGAAVDAHATAVVVSYAGLMVALCVADRPDFYVTRTSPAGGIATALTLRVASVPRAPRRSLQDVLLGTVAIHDRLPRRGDTDESPRSCLG